MVTDELIAIIQEKYKKGEGRDAIKASLMEEGWDESDIDAAISHIQYDALKHFPGISHVIEIIEKWNAKIAHSSPKFTAIVLVACAVIVMLIAIGLNVIFDPQSTKNVDRDKQRETDVIKLRNALNNYYNDKQVYPATLESLQPTYVGSLPHDPQTGAVYDYKPFNGTANYELCIVFELRPQQCISPDPSSSGVPLVISTPTPEPTISLEFNPSSSPSQ